MPPKEEKLSVKALLLKHRVLVSSVVGAFVVCLSWVVYRQREKKKRTRYVARNVTANPLDDAALVEQAVTLINGEWPNKGDEYEPLLRVALDDTTQSSEHKTDSEAKPVPCHWVVIETGPSSAWQWSLDDVNGTQSTVVAHVYLSHSFNHMDTSKLKKMIRLGLPTQAIVSHATKAGMTKQQVDAFLKAFAQSDNNNNDNDNDNESESDKVTVVFGELNVGSLVVHPRYRRRGFAKYLLSHVLLFTHSLQYHSLCGHAHKKLVPFSERSGAQMVGSKVRTTNGFQVRIDHAAVNMAKDTIQCYGYGDT